MRVALYHPWVYLRGGAERVIAAIVERSRHDWTVFTHHHDPASTFPELGAGRVVAVRPGVSVRRAAAPLGWAAATIASTRLPDVGARALLVSSEGFGDFILARNRLPAVAYCHTPLKIVHDPVARTRLKRSSPAKWAVSSLAGPLFTAADRALWRRYRHAFANSHEVAARLARAGLEPRGATEVLHPGVDLARFDAAAPAHAMARAGGARARFVVAGRIMWQKDVELAIDAFAAAATRGAHAELVVAGAVDAKSVPYLAELRRRSQGLDVRFEVDVSDERMTELLGSALVVLHPSPNEDFGITPLEAMAAGTPVLAVDAGGVRETVVDGETGWLVPATPSAFADVLARVADEPDRAHAMAAACRRRAAAFSWNAFVGRIDEVMESVADGRAAPRPDYHRPP